MADPAFSRLIVDDSQADILADVGEGVGEAEGVGAGVAELDCVGKGIGDYDSDAFWNSIDLDELEGEKRVDEGGAEGVQCGTDDVEGRADGVEGVTDYEDGDYDFNDDEVETDSEEEAEKGKTEKKRREGTNMDGGNVDNEDWFSDDGADDYEELERACDSDEDVPNNPEWDESMDMEL